MIDCCAAQGTAHPGEAKTLVSDDDDSTGAPHRVDSRGEIGRGRHEQGDPVSGADTGDRKSRGELVDAPR